MHIRRSSRPHDTLLVPSHNAFVSLAAVFPCTPFTFLTVQLVQLLAAPPPKPVHTMPSPVTAIVAALAAGARVVAPATRSSHLFDTRTSSSMRCTSAAGGIW